VSGKGGETESRRLNRIQPATETIQGILNIQSHRDG
jgi:hypothetical protein